MTIKTRIIKLENKKKNDSFSLIMDLGNGIVITFPNNQIKEIKEEMTKGNNILKRIRRIQ